jgi:signal transduction histidine kinase
MKVPLSVRLFASHATVAAVGAVVAYLTVRILLPRLFDQRMGMMDGSGSGMGQANPARARMHDILLPAMNTALLIGLVASAAAAGAIALVVTRWLLRPLDAVRSATRRIAAGRYDGMVPLPAEPELAALATDVNTLARALADTESRRTRLLGEVAHEMRTPLTVLDGYVEGLIDGVFTADPDTLACLSSELRRLHRLTDDLSTLSRAEEQRLDLHPVDSDLADLTHRAATRLAPQFEDASITLTVRADPALSAHVDPDRITQLLTNLLGNALLATPADGTVTITARKIRDRAEITVTDTGVGLANDDTARIFERFYRVPGQPRRSAGSGVGLTIARGIARAHGGDITASSPGPGQGSRFTVNLPLCASHPTGPPGHGAQPR